MHGQRSTKPNIHLCILDLMMIFTEIRTLTSGGEDGDSSDITRWARYLFLGLCHKTLRVLEIPHFAGCLLNPGLGYIPDLNRFLPWDNDWFTAGITKETYRTTHKCIKNAENLYQPIWVPSGVTIRETVVNFYAKRLDMDSSRHSNNVPIRLERVSRNLHIPQSNLNRRRNNFALFGPKFDMMTSLMGSDLLSTKEQAIMDMTKYERYHKGYKQALEEAADDSISMANEALKASYDLDPRIFWSDMTHSMEMGSRLVSFARYIFSILAGSAGPEREFSRMGYLISSRRSSYTPDNTNKRLTLANLLPQKRRLEDLLSSRQLKMCKLFN